MGSASTTWTVRDVHDDGRRVSFIADYVPGGTVDFSVDVPSGTAIATDAAGRYLTRSGRAVIPVVEIAGQWMPRPEDLADPWVREPVERDVPAAIESACADHAVRMETADAGA